MSLAAVRGEGEERLNAELSRLRWEVKEEKEALRRCGRSWNRSATPRWRRQGGGGEATMTARLQRRGGGGQGGGDVAW